MKKEGRVGLALPHNPKQAQTRSTAACLRTILLPLRRLRQQSSASDESETPTKAPAQNLQAKGSAAMAARTPLSVSSLLASFPRLRRAPQAPPLLRLLGPRARASPLSTTASAAAAADDEVDGVDTVEQLLHPRPPSAPRGRADRLMKLQRRADDDAVPGPAGRRRWFPYLDAFRPAAGGAELSSREVVEVLEPYILEPRRDRIRHAVDNRSYAVCLVVEGLSDFGNVSAAFRSADALGVQSVHVISCDSSKRCRGEE